MINKYEISEIIADANMRFQPRSSTIIDKIRAYFMLVNHPKLSKLKKLISKERL